MGASIDDIKEDKKLKVSDGIGAWIKDFHEVRCYHSFKVSQKKIKEDW